MSMRRSSIGCWSGLRVVLCSTALWCLLATVRGQHPRYFFNNIPGNFCSEREDPCCLKRMDDCSKPIFGTLCYCDEFCNRKVNPDCCPDYGRVCQGYIPSPGPQIRKCEHNQQELEQGESIHDNCNTCTCLTGSKLHCTADRCLTDPALLQQIGVDTVPGAPISNRWGWTGANYSMFWGRKLDEGMLLRTGTKEPNYNANHQPVLLHYDPSTLPLTFDARSRWPGRIGPPDDQGWCGASWAFSTANVASDRLHIQSTEEKVELSVQSLVSCDKKGQQGCQGGRVQRAWNYLRKYGVVSDDCYPYTSGTTSQDGVCQIRPRGATNQRCVGGSQLSVDRKSLYHTQPAHRIRGRETDIQYEIMTDGPVQAIMKVYQDFFYYRSGVYANTGLSDQRTFQHHSVRLIGWGEEQSPVGETVKYWIAINSWGEGWGENGLFRIRRGNNESGIEEHILSVRPRVALEGNRRRRRKRGHGRL